MKYFKLVIFIFCYFKSIAQPQYTLEYKTGLNFPITDLRPYNDLIIDNNLSLGVKKNKTNGYIGLGREDWFLDFDETKNIPVTEYSTLTYHCQTYKITSLLEQQFLLMKSKLSFNLGVGAEVFIFNQIKESYIFDIENNCLRSVQPSVLLTFDKGSNIDGNHGFITSVPFSLIGSIGIQSQLKKLNIKLFLEPNFIRINYRNDKNMNKDHSFVFYSNLGFSLQYLLNSKQEK